MSLLETFTWKSRGEYEYSEILISFLVMQFLSNSYSNVIREKP